MCAGIRPELEARAVCRRKAGVDRNTRIAADDDAWSIIPKILDPPAAPRLSPLRVLRGVTARCFGDVRHSDSSQTGPMPVDAVSRPDADAAGVMPKCAGSCGFRFCRSPG